MQQHVCPGDDDGSKGAGPIHFASPAHQAEKDFADLHLTRQLPRFQRAWSDAVAGWTEQAITGNPWSNENDAPRSGYAKPAQIAGGMAETVIEWSPVPNRLMALYTAPGAERNPRTRRRLTRQEVHALADTGMLDFDDTTLCLYDPDPDAEDVLKMPANLCPEVDWTGDWVAFTPSGPRAWQDEYCEWAFTRNAAGRMTGVRFTCESAAYFLALWRVSPQAVLGLYRKTIDPAVRLEDLYLRYPADCPTGRKGEVVVDLTTGRPAYDPTNKWNSGTLRVPGSFGGAMHLTSPPNTLSAQIQLAAAASLRRPAADTQSPRALLCCARHGQGLRNCDRQIGHVANAIAAGASISMSDPVGPYLQQPDDWSGWRGPNGEDVSRCWRVVRGNVGRGPQGTDQILHAAFEIPPEAGFTLEDVTIDGAAVQHVGIIAEQLRVALTVAVRPEGGAAQAHACVVPRSRPQPAPLRLLPEPLFHAASPCDLPARLVPGTRNRFVLVVVGADPRTGVRNARVELDPPGLSAEVLDFLSDATAVPGRAGSDRTQGYLLAVTVDRDVPPGPVSVRALNPDEPADPSPADHPWAPGLAVVAASMDG